MNHRSGAFRTPPALSLLLATLLVASCGGADDSGTPVSGAPAPAPSPQACTATSFMGKSSVLIGGSMTDASANAAPFDARYLYLAGGIRKAGQCASSCDGSCGQWWGCWQDTSQPPGQYAQGFMNASAGATWQGSARPQIPVFTYYELLQSGGIAEGNGEVVGVNDPELLKRYLDDWRFLLQKIGSKQAMLHLEPDFWAYARNVNSNPHAIPAQVTAANSTDCASQENSVAGLARCMIGMTRKYAPNAKVGLHASPWLWGNSGDGLVTGKFMAALGADAGDFVVSDLSDRDAGFYQYHENNPNRWYTPTDSANFLLWSKAVAQTVGKPMVLWQIPLGNMAQNNTSDHWQDTHVDYLLGHMGDVADAKVAALLFGAGAGLQTTVESDGGNLISKTIANAKAGGTPMCK